MQISKNFDFIMNEDDPTSPISNLSASENASNGVKDEASPQRSEIRQNILNSIGSDQKSIVVAEVLSHFPELAHRFIRTQEWLRQHDSRDQESRKIRDGFLEGDWSRNWFDARVTLPYHPNTILYINRFHNEFKQMEAGDVTNVYRLPMRFDTSAIDNIQYLLDPDSYYSPYDAITPISSSAEPSRQIIQQTLETLEVGDSLLERWRTYLNNLKNDIEIRKEIDEIQALIKEVEEAVSLAKGNFVKNVLSTALDDLLRKLNEKNLASQQINDQLRSYLPEKIVEE